MKLSVIVITKNEEDVIDKCLTSIKDIAGDLLVIDAGSTDNTVSIAKKMGARVITQEFKNFADQRNIAAIHARGDWMLYLDADEQAPDKFKKEVKEAIKSEAYNGYYIRRRTFYYGIDWEFTDKVQRLFKKNKFKEWKGVVHETPVIEGEFGLIKNPIKHYTHRDFTQMLTKTNEWSNFEAELRKKANHPKMTPLRFLRVMTTAFLKSYIKEKGYRRGTAGVIEALYQSFSIFATYAKLWEMQDESKK